MQSDLHPDALLAAEYGLKVGGLVRKSQFGPEVVLVEAWKDKRGFALGRVSWTDGLGPHSQVVALVDLEAVTK